MILRSHLFSSLKNLVICLIITFGFSLPGHSQKIKPEDFGIKSKKALNYFLEGRARAQRRERVEALEAFRAAVELEEGFVEAHQQLGVTAFFMDKHKLARTHLEKAYELDASTYGGYYLGETYFALMEYQKAIPQYEKYLANLSRNTPQKKIAQTNLAKAEFAATHIQDSIRFAPINLGTAVNSPGDDYLPSLTADGSLLLFTSRRSNSTGGYNPMIRDYGEDFYVSEWGGDKWKSAINLGAPVNTDRNEGASTISQDGSLLLFTICDHPESLGRCDIFFSTRKGNKWSKPRNVGPAINGPAWESQPSLSHDGETLYFVSDRKGGKGGRDIWFSRLVGGQWSKAKNLAGPINSPGNEGSPFLHADGVSFYFSSDAHPGFGGSDLFVSYQTDDSWSKPKNLGYPLNTKDEEANIFINTKGNLGFINSTRPGGMGKSDIYSFELDERIRPQVATFLRGTVRDSLTQEPLRARIQLLDVESGDTLRSQFSDPVDGKFLMTLPLNRAYAALVEAKGYLFGSKHFYLKELEEETYFDVFLDLSPIRKGAQVVLNNIFFDTGKWELKEESFAELEVLVRYLTQNPSMKIQLQGHTDDVGSETDNLELSQNRAEAVQNFLQERGIAPERLLAKGFGESQPQVENSSEENRSINRRTEFKVVELE